MSAKKVFEKLVDIAQQYSWRLSSSLSARRQNRGIPGELLNRLSPEEREELQKLSSEDTSVASHNILVYCDSYPENTTTIHTLKKEESDE